MRSPGLTAAAESESDPLSAVLRTVRLTGALFFVWHASSPYLTPVPSGRAFAPILLPGARQIVSYHIVTHGSCWAALVGGKPMRLDAGDILLIPHGDAYVMGSSAQACSARQYEMEPSMRFFRSMAAGALPFVVEEGAGESISMRAICGFLGCDLHPIDPVRAALPRIVHLCASADPPQDRLQGLIDITLAEARQPHPGGRCMLVRLSELMFVEVVRRWLIRESAAAETGSVHSSSVHPGGIHPGAMPPNSMHCGWLAGLRDPVVGRALARLHGSPADAWTLEKLADQVGVSRSHLADCFARVVGQPPMQYLMQWRLRLAAQMLAEGSSKVAVVARDVGYRSEASFSRAFKRFAGVAPARWRGERGGNATAGEPASGAGPSR